MMPSSRSKRAVRDRLLEAARTALKNAYAPYSKFRVGAAVLTTTGALFTGCNVENASYGATNCAERTAIFAAVAQLGPQMKLEAIAVVNRDNLPCSPCGVCRQVIYEFGPNATVFFRGQRGWRKLPIEKLLPEGFRLT
jgi:cytidine deaminase